MKSSARVAIGIAFAAGMAAVAFRPHSGTDPGQSPLFTAPVQIAAAVDVPLPSPESAALRTIGDGGPVLRIDGGEEGFGAIADVAVTRGGDTVYVLDRMSASVSAFRPDGRLLFRFGRKGGGPGEFRSVSRVMVLPATGEMGVWDDEAQRLTLLTPASGTLRQITPSGLDGRVHRIAALADGFMAEVRSDPLQVSAKEQRGALVRLDAAGRPTATLLRFLPPGVSASQGEPAAGASVTTWLNPPTWSPEPSWDVLLDGTTGFAPGGPDVAYLIDPEGRALRLWRAGAPARVTRGDRLRHLDGLRQRRRVGAPGTPLTILEPLNRGYYARVRPAVTGTLVDPAGEVWTRRFDTSDDWKGRAREWDAVNPRGRTRRLRLPAGFEPLLLHGGMLYGVSTDDLHVERIVAFRTEERA